MPEIPAHNQVKSRKTPEEIRAERVLAVTDPKVKEELAELAKTRDAKLAEAREIQKQRYDKDVVAVRDQKIRTANGPQLTPPGMQPRPYLGVSGHERATMDAKAEVLSRYNTWLRHDARPFNDAIDKKLDAYERTRAEGRSDVTGAAEQAPRKLVKFEDRFPEDAKSDIKR
jgi:hypothetical protein